MKRTYTVQELKNTNDYMQNYTVDFKYIGCKTTMKVHIGLVGNHYDIVERLVKARYGQYIEILGARITGKPWQPVSPF